MLVEVFICSSKLESLDCTFEIRADRVNRRCSETSVAMYRSYRLGEPMSIA